MGNIKLNKTMNTTKDNFSMSANVMGLGGIGFSTADNSLTCDSQGNCMLKDKLGFTMGPDGQEYNDGVPLAPWRYRLADNSLTCDSQGNCMLKDDLHFGDKIKHAF